MTARDRILSAIRAALPQERPPPDVIAAEAKALLADPDTSRPRLVAEGLVDAFILKAEAISTTIDQVGRMEAVPDAVRRYLLGHGLTLSLALEPTPALTALDWTGLDTGTILAPDQPAALGMALWGIAESGSMIVHSGSDTPILLSFLPLHHIVVLRESDVLSHLEDYAARLAERPHPRNAILITGPSGTTDIEGSYVRGAHGPGFLHVILVSSSD
ncbi:LUD domain-containing protein [Roseovarius sp. M141]|uniref:LutC/YkgG family protein n=1 Tax=Roseovarius sp. M141 TaxID=2583806 RepID=UPI0020CCEC50|nr:LUD domain-containing protein [Roseovarius sp. M141]MCQ0090674.1 lactate utilization protein [Roseovarius sp. M141]